MDDINKHPRDAAPPETTDNAPTTPDNASANRPDGNNDNTTMPETDQNNTGNSQDNAKKDGFFGKIFAKKSENGAEADAKPGEAGTDGDANAAVKAQPQPDLAAELAEAKEKLLRLHADFDNYRKRIAREYNDVREKAKVTVISDFLPVYDYFLLAVSHAEQNADFNALKQGMQMILTEFKRAFDNLGAEEINATGKPFDAKWHEAVSQEPDETSPEGHIIRQWKSGFRLGDTLLRPATVVVSSGPPPPPPAAEAAGAAETGPETNN